LRALRQEAKGSLASARALPDTVFPTRIGISISQKVSKKAVVRNRIKRQIRGALRQLLPHLSTGWRIVVVVKPNATECGYEQFLQELKQLLTNAEVMDGC
jgi:ribonuclease P protein component